MALSWMREYPKRPEKTPQKTREDPKRPEKTPESCLILKKYHPVILNSHQPFYVEGDGNCIIMAVCLAAFGSADYYELLRLKVAQTVLFNPQYYHNSRADYVDVFNDNRIVLENYDYMLSNVLVLNRTACMHTMAATSCVLGAPIQIYCPPNKVIFFL